MTFHRATLAIAIALALAIPGCIGVGSTTDDAPPTAASTPTPTSPSTPVKPREVNDAPIPRISIHNDQDPRNTTMRGFKGDVLVLNGTNSTDPDGFVTAWEWEIFELTGGATLPESQKHSGARVPNIVFGTEGVKVIRLTVTDNLGKKASTSAFYYRDASYAYGDQFHWTNVQGEVTEEREHKLPVLAGAATLAAHIVVDGGARADVRLVDPAGTEHAAGATEVDGALTDNVTVAFEHGLPAPGEWTIKVTITYAPPGLCLPEAGCHAEVPVPFEASKDVSYGLDGVVWYGEKPAEMAVGDGHGHEH